MNNYPSYDSYAYKYPSIQQLQYKKNNTYYGTKTYMQPKTSTGEVNKTVLITVLSILTVLIIGWVILNFILYKDDKAWFKVYKAPPPPAGSIQPNGDGTAGSLDPAVNAFKNQQLAGYQALNPSTTPSEFGGFITTPPPAP
jgi:hypothetical protein